MQIFNKQLQQKIFHGKVFEAENNIMTVRKNNNTKQKLIKILTFYNRLPWVQTLRLIVFSTF